MKNNLKILCILFSFILLVSFTNATPALASSLHSSEEEVVNIPDENLRKILIRKLGKNNSDDITKSDLESLTILECTRSDIHSLEGLNYCKNLKYFTLGDSHVTDFSPISKLDKLGTINLDRDSLDDLSVLTELADLKSLYSLSLYSNNISDLKPLAKFAPKLRYLSLGRNNISDLSPVSNLSNLQLLSAEHNKISNPAPVTKLTHLSNLNLKSNNIIDITGKGYYNSESNCITWKTIYTLRPQSYKFCNRNVDFGEYNETIYSGTVYLKFK